MANPCFSGTSIIQACDMGQFLVDQTPVFDEIIMEDIRPSDGWLYNVSTGTNPMGTPVEVTQDRFRGVFPNTTKTWTRKVANGPGCTGNPCDPTEHQIGWGADRLTWYAETQSWGTPLFCYDQDMHITAAKEHVAQIISEILRPATTAISSNFLRKRHLLWAKQHNVANGNFGVTGTDGVFTFQWTNPITGLLAGPLNDEEAYFYTSVAPTRVFKLVPQMLQHRFNPLMLRGYAGKNPFKETSPFIELVSDMDTVWELEHLGGQQGVGGGDSPNVLGNWRFTSFDESTKYWRYGFSGQIANFMVRVDPMGLRFNFVADLGPAAAPNRYQYQVVLPYVNSITTGAGGAAGLGSDENPDFNIAHFGISQIHHKEGMQLMVPDAKPLNPEMPFGHRDFGGKWQFVMDNLGADASGVPISNKRRNKGQFIADFLYWVRPLHTEFLEATFHQREQFCIPEISPCSPDPGYPEQHYDSALPPCPVPAAFTAQYGLDTVPTGPQAGPIPQPPVPAPDIPVP
jgi:hypothetical protein